ncbi:MAG TPA: transposase zinc-binding domain-containing protein [Archangium sp.]|nr:transposase zinc-binding domain-containing protein [Archangium sp.]
MERDFARYLECGVLAHGFARVRCESCKDELLVAFSCKGRGVCPSCNAKRAHVTAAHLVERVLPHVPYRQWTLSFPHRMLALERLSRAEDSRIAYRMKRPLPDGTTHLLFTELELLRRVASLVPPPRANLTRFHGVFAPGAQLRPFLVPQAGTEEANMARRQAGTEEASAAPEAAASKEPMREQTPRVDWAGMLRRTFDFDVLACTRCGGRRRVLAYLTSPGGVRAILEHLELPTWPAKLAPAQGAGASAAGVVLSVRPQLPTVPSPCRALNEGGAA